MRRASWFNVTALTLGFAFLYLPMVLLVIYSFNSSKLVTVWAGFSTKWYGELLQNEAFLDAAVITLKVAVASSTWVPGVNSMGFKILELTGPGLISLAPLGRSSRKPFMTIGTTGT